MPVVGDLYAIKVETDVMYKETTATRRADMWAQFDLQRQLVADGSPLADRQLAGSLLHIETAATWPKPDRPRPAGTSEKNWQCALDGLAGLDDETKAALEAAAASATAVPTTLAAISPSKAVDCLWHGYTLAMVNFVIFEGHTWSFLQRQHFVDLVAQAPAA